MLQTIIDNAGNIVVSLLLIAVVTAIIAKLRRDRKRGKCTCSCGGSCESCAACGSCSACGTAQKK